MENANGVIKKLTSAERSYYTAAEVREMMGVSRDTAYRMIRSLRSDLIADGQLAKGCSCHEEHLIEMERKEKATAFVEKMVKEEKNGQLRLAV